MSLPPGFAHERTWLHEPVGLPIGTQKRFLYDVFGAFPITQQAAHISV